MQIIQQRLRGCGKQGASSVQRFWSLPVPQPPEITEHLSGPPLDCSISLFSYSVDSSQFVSERIAFLFMLHIPQTVVLVVAACHFDGVMTVWRQTRINITFLFKSCLETYCSPLPALLRFSHPLPWFWVAFWFNSVVARGPEHCMCRWILLIIQVMELREKRTNLFAQSCPEASPAGELQAHISLAGVLLSQIYWV